MRRGHPVPPWVRPLSQAFLLPAGLAAAFLILASLLPVRFDRRTLQGVARLEGLSIPPGATVVFLSADNEVQSFDIAAFALPLLAFPRGDVQWLTLQEATHGVWSGSYTGVDAGGGFHASVVTDAGWTWRDAETPAWLARPASEQVAIFASPEVRQEFLHRLPGLEHAGTQFVLPARATPGLALARPRRVFSITRWLRLSAILGVMAAPVVLLRRLSAGRAGESAIATGVGYAAGIALVIAAAYISGELWPASWGAALATLWIALGATVVLRRAAPTPAEPAHGRPMVRVVVVLVAAVYVAVAVLRLDFDGDTYSTYLPVAKYYLWHGHHDTGEPGLRTFVQATTYPPGFPVVLALAFWAADVPPEAPLRLDAPLSAAILSYRLLVAGLGVALMLSVTGYLRALGAATALTPLAACAGTLLLLPPVRGEHTSAETLLVPLFGCALVGVLAGRRLRAVPLAAAAFFVAGALTLLKLDGAPYLLFLIVPAAMSVRADWGWRATARVAACGCGGLVPFVVWRATGPTANAAFARPSGLDLDAMWTSMRALAPVAAKVLVRSELWTALALMVAAALFRGAGLRDPRSLLLPAGVAALAVGWVVLLTFSTIGRASHLELSYGRIMLAPAFAAWLYALETAAMADGPASARLAA